LVARKLKIIAVLLSCLSILHYNFDSSTKLF